MKYSLCRSLLGSVAILAALISSVDAAGEIGTRPDQAKFREIYKELVETDTSVATGSCTVLADKIEKMLKDGGYSDGEIVRHTPAEYPKSGGMVVTLAGSSKTEKAILLLGHLDVVNANPQDWTRSPFKFIEENGYFYGRGTADMKDFDAIWIDTMLRLKAEGRKQRRTLKMALTCGEEGGSPFNGARWLTQNQRELIDAKFGFNEMIGGDTDGHDKLLNLKIQTAQKGTVNFQIEATNPGGHSSQPVPDNAIYDLSRALLKIASLRFPVVLNEATRGFFTKASIDRTDALAQAMRAIVANPQDKAAEDVLSADRLYNGMLHTTCVATMLQGGHASNALPQRATATVNCRFLPGDKVEDVRAALVKAVDNPAISISTPPRAGAPAPILPLSDEVLKPMEKLAKKHFPGVPLAPFMTSASDDSRNFSLIGIPVYGAPGMWNDPDGNGLHGLNERRSVRGVYLGRDFMFDYIKTYLNS
jgi:acetylornithine deacetylase/succinyl-diaminopimelate desuccinylase-like protein